MRFLMLTLLILGSHAGEAAKAQGVLWRYVTERTVGVSTRYLTAAGVSGSSLTAEQVDEYFKRSLDLIGGVSDDYIFGLLSDSADKTEAYFVVFLSILHHSNPAYGLAVGAYALNAIRLIDIDGEATAYLPTDFMESVDQAKIYAGTDPRIKALDKSLHEIREHTALGASFPPELIQKRHNVNLDLAQKLVRAVTMQEQINLLFKDYARDKSSYQDLIEGISTNIEEHRDLFEAWELAGIEDALCYHCDAY